MLDTLSSISVFSNQIDWNKFTRYNLNSTVLYNNQKAAKVFCCGTGSKFIMYVMRTNTLDTEGKFKIEKRPNFIDIKVSIPDVSPGAYKISSWKEDTKQNSLVIQNTEVVQKKSNLTFLANLNRNLILYIEKI